MSLFGFKLLVDVPLDQTLSKKSNSLKHGNCESSSVDAAVLLRCSHYNAGTGIAVGLVRCALCDP